MFDLSYTEECLECACIFL